MNCENSSGRYRRLENQDTCIYQRTCSSDCTAAVTLPGTAVCDISSCANLSEVICSFNELLQSLRCAGLIAPCCNR